MNYVGRVDDPDFDIFENLPEDPEQAFLLLEDLFHFECEQEIHRCEQDRKIFCVDYIARVIAAIKELGLEQAFEGRVPDIKQVDYSTYANFSRDVKYYRTRLKIRFGRRHQSRSVGLDKATKTKLRNHTQHLRDLFKKLEVETAKKDHLLHQLHEFENEIGFMRMGFDAYAVLAIETAGIMGDANPKPKILDALNAIARTISNFRKDQEQRRLAEAPRQLAPPNLYKLVPQWAGTNDDIPF